jgi:hypothetical protein
MCSVKDYPEHRRPLLNFLACLPEHDIGMIYNVLDLAHHNLIYESTDEHLLMDEFLTTFFIAARAEKILKR